MAKLQVAVLFGGRSVEHEVSLVSARSIINALDATKYVVVPVGITKEGRWLGPKGSVALLDGNLREAESTSARNTDFTAPNADVVFPVTHGTFGEDGALQGFLELTGLPYVGTGVLASALGMDKHFMKRIFQEAGLPIVPFLPVLRRDWERSSTLLKQKVGARLGYPCFVKPANSGSSVGISKVHGPEELAAAVELALSLDRKALIEMAVAGRELECSVLGNDDPVASVVGEIIPAREFYDYEAKYHDDRTQLLVPAALSDAIAEEVQKLAIRAFQAIDGAGMARVDFFLRASDDKLFVNEINTIPGFTPVSMYPRMWEASGLAYPALLDRLIELALERHQEQRRTRFSFKQPQPA